MNTDTDLKETKKAKVVSVRHTLGYRTCITGVKDGQIYREIYKEGAWIVRGGYGSYVIQFDSHLVLTVKVGRGKTEHEIWAEKAFRKALGVKRLSPKMQRKIIDTMPESVDVIPNEYSGPNKFQVSNTVIQEWADRVRALK